MINEVVECENYLDGKNINKRNLYRICYLLAKYFKEQGMSHIDIRNSIFEWAKKNNIYIHYNLNKIIYHAVADKKRLKDNIIIKINDKDIKEIINRFDSKNTRLTALAILCYAKAYANRDGEFTLSSISLGAWINIVDQNLRSRHIKELIDFEYISRANKSSGWNKNNGRSQKYKINVDIHNSGKYCLIDNNIIGLYEDIFFCCI